MQARCSGVTDASDHPSHVTLTVPPCRRNRLRQGPAPYRWVDIMYSLLPHTRHFQQYPRVIRKSAGALSAGKQQVSCIYTTCTGSPLGGEGPADKLQASRRWLPLTHT